MSEPRARAIEAEVALEPGTDPAAVGAAVTVELCGHWEHEGPCRWAHNNAIDAAKEPAFLRTVFVADRDETDAVAARIESSLRAGIGWRVIAVAERPVAADDQLAARLLAGPRAER